MHCVIDFDQAVYACGFASDGEPRSHTYRLLDNKLNQIIQDTKCTSHQIYIGGENNFRDDLDFSYKANRTAPRPESYEDARWWLTNHRDAMLVDGMETDDMVSICLFQDYVNSGGVKKYSKVILSSPDKDLKNTPGWHYNPQKRTTQWITMSQANRHFWWQMLWGDPTDNIKGLTYATENMRTLYGLRRNKGFGERSATTIMRQSSDAEETVHLCYADWGLDQGMSQHETLEYMGLQGQLLWMVRELDNYGNPVIWEPDINLFDDCWKALVETAYREED